MSILGMPCEICKNEKLTNQIGVAVKLNCLRSFIGSKIKMTGNPKATMGSTNQVLDKIPEKKRGLGAIMCLIDKKTYLRENLIALPIEYI